MRHCLLYCVLLALTGCQPADNVAQSLLMTQCSNSEAPPASVAAACTSLIDAPDSTPPTLAFAHGNRSLARRLTGDLDGALADLNRVVELTPDSADALGSRGTLHGMRGEFDAAARDLTAAIKLDPNIATLHADLGTSYERGGKPDLALPAYDRAIELDPKLALAVGARCWVLTVLDRDLDKAIADCDRALELDPKDLNHYNSRGFARFRQRQYELAIADYDRSLGGAPVASSFYMRGLAKRALGRTDEGDADIVRGKQLEPGIVDALCEVRCDALGTATMAGACSTSSAYGSALPLRKAFPLRRASPREPRVRCDGATATESAPSASRHGEDRQHRRHPSSSCRGSDRP